MDVANADAVPTPDGLLPGFRNLGPTENSGQREALHQQVDLASGEADIVIISEYGLRETDRNAIREQLRDLKSRLKFVVGGSSLVPSSTAAGRFVNEGCMWTLTDGFAPLEKTFQKFTPAIVEFDGIRLAEDIVVSGRPEIVVWWTHRWAICVLLCRDAASGEVISQLAKMGVNLLLVGAFTDRVSNLAHMCTRLATESQAFVAVSINPSVCVLTELTDGWLETKNRPDAVFAGPYEYPLDFLNVPSNAGAGNSISRTPLPGVWTFDTKTRTAQWRECPLAGTPGPS